MVNKCFLTGRVLAFAVLVCVGMAVAAGTQVAGAATVDSAARTFTVQWVHDGDTLRLDDGQSVRLAGIDSPEIGKKGESDQYYAREALNLAMRLARNRQVTLRPVSPQPLDRYRRMLAEIILPDGTSLNESMVAGGAAWVYWHRDLHKDFLQRLLEAQRTALREERGMWRKVLSDPAAAQPYVGNSRSYRFYPAGSPEATRIGWSNVVRLASLKDAFWEGYAPARLRDPARPDAAPRANFMPQ